jgi:hypothetical protein
MPRLQFTRDEWVEKTPPAMISNSIFDDTDKKELRQEIKRWWQALAEHLDKVVSPFPSSYSPDLNPPAGGRVYCIHSTEKSTSFALR